MTTSTTPTRRVDRSRRTAVVVAAAALLTPVTVATAAPASASAAGSCWSYTVENSISKLNRTQVSYATAFRWCAERGRVVSFVVDKAYAVPGGWTKDAGIDVQPFRPGDFGRPSYDIYVNVWGDQKPFPLQISYKGITASVTAGRYQDYWDISLNGNGTVNGTRHKVR